MLKRRILLTIAFLYSLNFINSAQIDYMCVKLKGDFTKSYKIDDVRKVIFPTKKEMGIVPYIGEVVIYSLDDLVRVLFTNASEENILYVDEDMIMDENSSYDAVIIAENGNSDIYLDIGDEQSIEKNLSTFSSHMSKLINIIDNIDDNSLVLLDEIGGGTDPKEGEALAMAIIDYLYNRKTLGVITTHYSNLKTFAIEKEYIETFIK